ncbi:MAG TPA: protein kinase [Pyrinomonadaceae bacterium]|nr:protein kinase [Pyrinomonadaceae bacterium]
MKYCAACKEKYDDSVSFCPVDGEVLEDDPSSLVNTVLDGQYQMEALLGKGGMGAVYQARHILLGDRVAIKVLPPEVRSNAEWLRRFRREGQAARRFRHQNAVTVYDLRTAADGTIYMVMEYVEGHTLDAEIKKRGRFIPREALEIMTPIMSVLDTAHAMGVVHRDLKPENIMVGNPTGNGAPVIKLLDLGIAKMREIAGVDTAGNTALTTAGQVLGTPYYMSPEQWGEIPRDGNQEIDGRADIYSLGLVFYEMIAGRRCFTGNTLLELRREHISTKPKPLIEVVPNVPKAFSDAIERATAKDRGDRQATAAVLAQELSSSLASVSSDKHVTDRLREIEDADTVALPRALQTKSDTNAPTIITLDPLATLPPPLSEPLASTTPSIATEVPKASNTVVESGLEQSSATVPQVPIPRPVVEAPARKSRAAGLIIGLGAVLVILFVVVAGGIYLWSRSRATSPPVTTSETNLPAAPVARDVSRYWLELERTSGASSRVAGLVPIASGQSFKMHFAFKDDGYLYIVGPGNNNKPTVFLSAQPLPASGVQTNKVIRDQEFSFPNGTGNNLTLDNRPGTDNFRIVFSKTPLTSPAFFNDKVTGEPLNATQQTELDAFLSKYQQKSPASELDESNRNAPFVRVKVVGTEISDPLVFDVRIQHN